MGGAAKAWWEGKAGVMMMMMMMMCRSSLATALFAAWPHGCEGDGFDGVAGVMGEGRHYPIGR